MVKFALHEKRFPRIVHSWMLFLSITLFLIRCILVSVSGDLDSDGRLPISPPEQKRFVYLCEDLSLTKYQDIAQGILERCAELNVVCNIVDGKGRSEMLMSYIEELGRTSVDALLVSALTEPLGPLILSKCHALDIPIFTVSSRLKDGEGQEIPGIEIQGNQSGRNLAAAIAEAIFEEAALDLEKPVSVIMCKMSNLTDATEIVSGFLDEFSSQFPSLGSDSYVQLEVISASAEGQYFSINNYFSRTGAETQYVILSFNDDGCKAVTDYIREAHLDPNRLLFCAVGAQKNSRRVFEEEPLLAGRYYSVSTDYPDMGRQAVDYMYAYMEKAEPLPYVFTPPGKLISAENYRELLYP